MASASACLSTVATLLQGAGVATIIKEFSNVTPPTTIHAVLSHELSSLAREDDGCFWGSVTVEAQVFLPGVETDGETEYLAAMDAFDAIVTACATGAPSSVREVEPGRIERLEESADMPHWYSGTVALTFLRKEP